MNKHVTSIKTDVTEVFYFDKNSLPFLIHSNMIKRKGTIFLVNKHANPELLFITEGEMEIHLGNDVFYVKRGDAVFVNPNILHNIIPITNFVTYHCIIIDTNFLETNGLSLENIHINEILNDEYISGCGENIANLVFSKDVKYQIAKANAILLNLTIYLFENYSSVQSTTFEKSNTKIIEKAVQYINSHITEQITIEDLADYTGYSKFYFCRTFREITGFTPTTYVNMQKIKYAHSMLAETDATVNDVSLKFGFKSTSYFSTTFKRYTGINPSDIKHKIQRGTRTQKRRNTKGGAS